MRKNSGFITFITVLMCVLILQNGIEIHAEETAPDEFLELNKKKYSDGKYGEVIAGLEKYLSRFDNAKRQLRGKLFLLLGAAYEMKGEKEKAVQNYLLGDLLADRPEIEGIELKDLKIFRETLFENTIAGKRVIEKVGVKKKRKKFPFIAVIGVAALATAVLLLMNKKSGGGDVDKRRRDAEAVFNEIQWVQIDAGEFLMGDDHGLGEDDEKPVHRVQLDVYKISKYEITYGQFQKFMEANPDLRSYHRGLSDDHPVTNVGRGNAEFFCEWLSEYTGKKISLPTEAQWEKAARGTDRRIYPWGNTPPDCTITNINYCTGQSQAVGLFTRDVSFYGVMGMGGNVSELIRDRYQADYYSSSPVYNPAGPDDLSITEFVVRGGNWSSSDPRASNRDSLRSSSSGDTIGFRIVWNE